MTSLNEGHAEKVGQDRIREVKKRASNLYYGYISAKKAFKSDDAEYHSDNTARINCDNSVLYGVSHLKSFKQTGWTYYRHYSGRFALSISNVIGDKSYIEVKLSS